MQAKNNPPVIQAKNKSKHTFVSKGHTRGWEGRGAGRRRRAWGEGGRKPRRKTWFFCGVSHGWDLGAPKFGWDWWSEIGSETAVSPHSQPALHTGRCEGRWGGGRGSPWGQRVGWPKAQSTVSDIHTCPARVWRHRKKLRADNVDCS